MKYRLFIDESGDHGLSNIDPDFPVFVLCGVLFSETEYEMFRQKVNALKKTLWNNIEVIFHSRDIRKHEKEFQIFFDMEKKAYFYNELNNIIAASNYVIISSAIHKSEYIKKYGKFGDVYSVALSFIIERTIFCLDKYPKPATLDISVEKRGWVEDENLLKHYNEVYSSGTFYVTPERIRDYQTKLKFISKKENINGLQLADLLAYPIARHIIEPKRANPAFDIFSAKFYTESGKRYGLNQFP